MKPSPTGSAPSDVEGADVAGGDAGINLAAASPSVEATPTSQAPCVLARGHTGIRPLLRLPAWAWPAAFFISSRLPSKAATARVPARLSPSYAVKGHQVAGVDQGVGRAAQGVAVAGASISLAALTNWRTVSTALPGAKGMT